MPPLPDISEAADDSIREKILDLVRAIPSGRASSYGAIGASCEPPISGYICGRILQNVPEGVPWWRVVGKDGTLPISKRSPHLAEDQKRRLESEGVGFSSDGKVRMGEFGA